MKVELYDTTLRDGSQTEGISFSVNDKLRITKKLDDLGIHYIEGGWPGSNPKDRDFFNQAKKLRLKNSTLVGFGSTRRAHLSASKDSNLRALAASGAAAVTIFGKSGIFQVKEVLRISLEENLKMISESITYLKSKGLKVFYDAEHFFDSYKDEPSYALKTLQVANDAGAEVLILCDTNGGTITSELVKILNEVKGKIKAPLGIHTHNDCDMAVANSLAAVEVGCLQVQGTINGYGERCGNADLCAIIANLKLKLKINCLSDGQLKKLTETSRYVAEISNMKQQENQSFVGTSAFAHKAGVHVNAVVKNPASYEHIDPSLVGNRRKILVSELAGKTGVLVKAKELDLDLTKETPQTKRILKQIQNLEHQGYYFEAAEASFELLMKRALKKYKRFFNLEGFKVVVEKRQGHKLISEATIKLKVNKVQEHTAAEGDGPVNALDKAVRKALNRFYPSLAKMHLSDFKVRVLDQKAGTAAKVRVLIQSQDENNSWWTVGVSENIIEASWQALVDSIEYKLLKDIEAQSRA